MHAWEVFMKNSRVHLLLPLAVIFGTTPSAHAQFAVIDVASLNQLVSEVQTLSQHLAIARNQLAQSQAEYQSITGTRGMGVLLAGTSRNYLPSDWNTLRAALQGSSGYQTLASDLQGALNTAAVLSPARLAALSPVAGAHLQAERRSVALAQGVSHEALANASSRFAAVQQLIDAIEHAADQKSILDLQARIAAEQGMLQNERTKLQVLYQGVQAEEWANAQQGREQTVSAHGQFSSRFRPQP
jgi:type IV secretion system protein VirB5